MIRLDVDGRLFHVEFRHERRRFARELAAPHPHCAVIRAITTCVIMAPRELKFEFVAIGNAICWRADNFVRRRGRLKALVNALKSCGALPEIQRAQVFAAYMAVDPDPPPRVPTPKLSFNDKAARWNAGWQVRLNRAAARGEQPAARGEGL